MAEKLTLTAPVTNFEVATLELRWKENLIRVVLEGPNGDQLEHLISGPAATGLMVALNKANLSANSLHRRILQQLITDGVLAGTVTGAPD